MDLTLTDDERALLQELLSSAFRDLRMEIADTDNPRYRDGLIARREAIDALLRRVGGLLELS